MAARSQPTLLMSVSQFAGCMGISRQRVDQLIQDGTLTKAGTKMDFVLNARLYAERLRENAAGRTGEGQEGEKIDPIFEKAMKDRVDRQINEIKLAKARGEVMQSSEILAVMQTVMGAVRARLLALPNRLPTMIHGMTKDHIQIVKGEVNEILKRLVADGEVVLKDLQNKAIDDE